MAYALAASRASVPEVRAVMAFQFGSVGAVLSGGGGNRDPEATRVHVDKIAALSDEQRLVFWSPHTLIMRCWVIAVREKGLGSRDLTDARALLDELAQCTECSKVVRLGRQASRGRQPINAEALFVSGPNLGYPANSSNHNRDRIAVTH